MPEFLLLVGEKLVVKGVRLNLVQTLRGWDVVRLPQEFLIKLLLKLTVVGRDACVGLESGILPNILTELVLV